MTNKTTTLMKPVSTTLNDNHRILAQGRYINNNTGRQASTTMT